MRNEKKENAMKNATVSYICLAVFVFCGVSNAETTDNNPWNSIGMDTSKAETQKAERLALIDLSREVDNLNQQVTTLNNATTSPAINNADQNVTGTNEIKTRLEKVERATKRISNKSLEKKIAAALEKLNPLIDVAAIAANASDHEKFRQAMSEMSEESAKLKTDLSQRVDELDKQVQANTADIKDLQQEVDDLKKQVASTSKEREHLDKLDETLEIGGFLSRDDLNSLKSEIEEIKADVAATQTMAKNASDNANSATAAIEPLQQEVTKLKERQDKLEAEQHRESRTAIGYPSNLIREVDGVGAFFTPGIKSGLIGGGALGFAMGFIRVTARLDIGLSPDSYGNVKYLTYVGQIEVSYAWQYVWLGLVGGTYGTGTPLTYNDEYGFSGGLVARLTFSGKSWWWKYGLRVWLCTGWERHWESQGPPEGAAPGAIYADEKMVGEYAPVSGGGGLFITF